MIVLVLGGTRSGKSELAEQLTARLPAPVTYVATATLGTDGVDEDLAARVARHRERRPGRWHTLEVGGDPPDALPDALAETPGTVLVDSLGTWLAGRPGFDADVGRLCAVLRRRRGDTVVVSDEVGLGVHPSTEVGRRFRDALGSANRAVAAEADRVLLVVAGRALELQPAADVLGAVTDGDERWFGAFRGALGFLTVAGGAATPVPAATAWFPLVGLLVGAAIGVTWWAAAMAFPPAVAAGLAVAADLALTGMLHLDGLADSADGLLPPLPRNRRLEVMRSPDVGAFGVAAVVSAVGLRWAALAELAAPGGDVAARRIFLLGGLWAASRAVMAGTLLLLPYARPQGGLAARFRGGTDGPAVPGLAVALPGIGLAAVACAIGLGAPGLVALGAGLLVAGGVVALALRRLGGFTGDVLGAAGFLCETAGLVVATAWR